MNVAPASIYHDSSLVALLVDRDADTRRMYAEYLQLVHYEIDEASDGREALAKALTRHHDIVVTETRLTGISGYDLCGLLRRDPATHSTPIIVVTADAFAADLERARKAGADCVLVKPCLPEKLLEAIRAITDQSRQLRARTNAARKKGAAQIERSKDLLDRSAAPSAPRKVLSRAFNRHDTYAPPLPPPELVCPVCDRSLTYQRSHMGGVSARHPEQWDYFECKAGHGTFQYRQRTRKLRKVS